MKHKIFIFSIVAALLVIVPKFTKADFVVNHTISTNEMSRDELTQIFLFLKKYESKQGVRMTVILPPPDSYLFKVLATSELGSTSSQYLANVRSKIAAGTAQPIFAETEAEILIKVSNTPYSIGYYYDAVKLNDGFGVKTISIK